MAHINADIAVRAGCTGVFVISMEGHDNAVTPVAREIKLRHPGLRVGVNYLSLAAPDALARSLENGLHATWSDRPGVSSAGPDADGMRIARVLRNNPMHLFFGSVAFKYQPVDPCPEQAAVEAAKLHMIATTSGLATGEPPTADKLFRMRQSLGEAPLAVASGISPDNAFELGRFLTHVLVATGISKSFYEFDEALLVRLLAQLD